MSNVQYRRSELIELLDLVGELMDGGVDRLTAWRQIHAAARDCRLESIYVEIKGGQPPKFLGQADLDPGYCLTEIADQTFVEFYQSYDRDWDPRYYTVASVRKVFPQLPMNNGPSPPQPVPPSAVGSNPTRLRPLPKAREPEVFEFLSKLGPVSETEAMEALKKHFPYHISRERFRGWERPKRPRGRLPRQRRSR